MRAPRGLAFAASLILHLVVLVLLVRPPPGERRGAEPIEVEIQHLPPPRIPTPAAPALSEPPPRPPTRSSPRRAVARARAEAAAPAPQRGPALAGSPAGPAGPGEGEAASGAPAPGPGGKELSRELDLSLSARVGGWALRSGAERGRRGETWRNEPGGFPDPEAERQAGAERGRRNVQGWLADGLATARAEGGGVDGYFYRLQGALQEEASRGAQGLLGGDARRDLVTAWGSAARTFGERGSPYAAGKLPGPAPAIEGDTALNLFSERFHNRGVETFDDLKTSLEMGRSLRDFADGKFSAGLVAIVEIRQGSDGRLVELGLRQPSGSAAFDAYVLRAAPVAIETLPAPPEKGGGLRPEGLRSTWSFQGKIVYRRRLRDMSLLRDGWYVALLGAAGLATGSFDETTGEVEIPDLRHPQFNLEVKLLQVY